MLSRYTPLTSADIQMVHEASLEILQTTGLRLNHPVALEKLADAGATVDKDREKVHLPADLVEKAVRQAPDQFVCAGRTPEYDVHVSSDAGAGFVVRSTGGANNYFDPLSNTSRTMTLQDCRDIATVVDALGNFQMAGCIAPPDAPPETYDLHVLKTMLEAGRKHIWALPKNSKNLRYQIEMMKTVAGGSEALRQRPLCSGIVCIIEPLHFPSDEIDRLLLYSEHNLPVRVPLAPMAGANSPYSLAGTLALTNAEALGSLVLLQTLSPGIPTWYYGLIHDMDMRSGIAHYHSPELLLMTAGVIQMARHYGIPSIVGPYMTTNCQPHQIMFERGTALTMYALCGASELGGAGSFDGGSSMSLLALVIDDELAAYTRRIMEGFDLKPDTLAVEAVQRVGHRGSYLMDQHTLEFLHKEKRFTPDLFDWRPLESWGIDGKTIFERAGDKVNDILKRHEVPPLEEPLLNELDRILKSWEKEVKAG